MPCVMEQRAKFIMEVLDGTYSMSELCDYYGISRKTGYKWLTPSILNYDRLESGWAAKTWPTFMSHDIVGALDRFKRIGGDIKSVVAIISRCRFRVSISSFYNMDGKQISSKRAGKTNGLKRIC